MMARVLCCIVMLGALCGCRGRKIAASDLYNVPAALPAGLPYPVLEWKAITASVDRGNETMSTLFGNDAAVAAARAGVAYPPDAVLGLVTWREREDPHWFGARIPGQFVSAEFVPVGSGADRKFVGTPLQQVAGTPLHEATGTPGRVAQIEAMKPVSTP